MKPLRIQKLRDAALDAPHCMNQSCRAVNWDGQQLVLCHPNGLRFEKGTGQKGHDLGAYLCNRPGGCHDLLDGRAGALTRLERDEMFLDAAYWSTVWLIQSGRLVAK